MKKYAREEIESIIIKLRILIGSHFDSGEQALANELLSQAQAAIEKGPQP